ncbi:MAG: PilT/PilU family type 4a pilus ATPase [Methyloprofundus sp.]|nr:PilT/PilU family type 4a pilus ATPase [Methyloprofundus sp.]MDT8424414.1 PilT/PilU family type 4a pilus ATPase [Methyloprofundus sp.]
MDITPYLKLMVDKRADSLIFSLSSAPRLRLLDQEKPVGNTPLSHEMLNEIFQALTSDSQRLQFSIDKTLRFDAPLFGGQNFVIEAVDKNDQLLITISTDKRQAAANNTLAPKNIQVLGAAPSETLDIFPYLEKMVSLEGSDLFITSGSPVKTKVHGSAMELDSYLLTPELTKSAAYAIMSQEQIEEFERTKDLDFAITLADESSRFRVNAFYQRRTIGIVLRLIPAIIPTAKELDLPEVLTELIMDKRGLLLMVGGTGSGKSTSLAAMINHRNINAAGHILTIEDPIEFSHPNIKSIVNQREVGVDTSSYARALKASLREAPDVILIGEIRDRETMEAALELANTGHLCLSTLHANNANQAMERIINMFPQVQHKQLFMDLATNLNAVISQRLIPDIRGKRCAAIEVMINTPHISNLILKGELNEIKEAMKSSGSKGMQAFDEALLTLYKAEKISLEEALKNADSRNDLEAKVNFG